MLLKMINDEVFLYSFTDQLKTIRLDSKQNPIKDQYSKDYF